MNMNIRTSTVLTLQLTEKEVEILKSADKILLQVQNLLEGFNKDDIMALETGEIVDYEGLARARGIMDGIAEHVTWELDADD